MENKMIAKKGDVIFIIDCSFAHEVGTKYVEDIINPKSSDEIRLIYDIKGKEAVVEKEPYKDTIIFIDEESTYTFIDVYIKDIDKHVSIIADYPDAHAKSKEEFDFKTKMAQYEADIIDEYYEPCYPF